MDLGNMLFQSGEMNSTDSYDLTETHSTLELVKDVEDRVQKYKLIIEAYNRIPKEKRPNSQQTSNEDIANIEVPSLIAIWIGYNKSEVVVRRTVCSLTRIPEWAKSPEDADLAQSGDDYQADLKLIWHFHTEYELPVGVIMENPIVDKYFEFEDGKEKLKHVYQDKIKRLLAKENLIDRF